MDVGPNCWYGRWPFSEWMPIGNFILFLQRKETANMKTKYGFYRFGIQIFNDIILFFFYISASSVLSI